ncbi:hypothetical protein PR048_027506 [Dryococelus australis]|uniref:Uncharacterized protein n=1 Tax=Dryococelus australis TaxID=614101 RepID=A0ABQ9GGQ1_9NEOP|nr:hypothetical protein PR048_027506 [Dryococelus australis]
MEQHRYAGRGKREILGAADQRKYAARFPRNTSWVQGLLGKPDMPNLLRSRGLLTTALQLLWGGGLRVLSSLNPPAFERQKIGRTSAPSPEACITPALKNLLQTLYSSALCKAAQVLRGGARPELQCDTQDVGGQHARQLGASAGSPRQQSAAQDRPQDILQRILTSNPTHVVFASRNDRKAVQCWDAEIRCEQPARSVYLNTGLLFCEYRCHKPRGWDLRLSRPLSANSWLLGGSRVTVVFLPDGLEDIAASIFRAKMTIAEKVVDFLDLKLMQDPVYVSIAIGLSGALVADISFFSVLPIYLAHLGVAQVDVAVCIAVGAACDLAGRIALALLGLILVVESRTLVLIGLVFTIIFRTSECCRSMRKDRMAMVAERLDCSPPTKVNRVQSLAGHSGFSQVGIIPDDATCRRVSSWISRFPRPFNSPLLHSHLISPSSALKTSLLRAAKIPQLDSKFWTAFKFPIHITYCYICCFLFVTVFIFYTDYIYLTIFTGLISIFRPFLLIELPLVFAEYCSLQRFPSAYGLFMITSGMFALTLGPIVGNIIIQCYQRCDRELPPVPTFTDNTVTDVRYSLVSRDVHHEVQVETISFAAHFKS